MNNYSIGIDFGTTKTLVAHTIKETGETVVAHIGREKPEVPTIAYADEDGVWEFGEDAEDAALENEVSVCRHFRNELGSDKLLLQLPGKEKGVNAGEITTLFLTHIRKICEEEVFNGHSVTSTHIAVPSWFSEKQKKELQVAARAAGFNDIHLVNEAAAAMLYHLHKQQTSFSGSCLVICWDDSSFDWALLSVKPASVVTYSDCCGTDSSIGLTAYDEQLDALFLRRFREEHHLTNENDDPQFRHRRLQAIRRLKRQIASQETASLKWLGASRVHPQLTVSQKECESAFQPFADKGLSHIKTLLSGLHERSIKPSLILLVSAAKELTAFAERVKESTGLSCASFGEGREAIASGAAIAKEGKYTFSTATIAPKKTSDAVASPQFPAATDSSEKEKTQQQYITKEEESASSTGFITLISIVALLGIVGLTIILGEAYNQPSALTETHSVTTGTAQNTTSSRPEVEKETSPVITTPKQETAEELFQAGLRYAEQKEHASAVAKFRAAAEQGYADAQCNLGYCYANGLGVAQDAQEAVVWYHKAAEQGNAIAQSNLGFCYANGRGVAQDQELAVSWYLKAAEQEDASAQNDLGCRYENGIGVAQDLEQAVFWYRKAAEHGDEVAQWNLGYCYANGRGVEQDWSQAAVWFRKSAEQGYATAQGMLGWCYENGQGVGQNFSNAAEWFRKAAEQGHIHAQNDLGMYYAAGQGVNQDWFQAAVWFRKAAEQGDARAQFNLGNCYANGQGVEQNWTHAAVWFLKAAEQGYAYAQFALGVCYENGLGVSADWGQAFRWYQKAAEQGHADAQFCLALCYAKGNGVTADREEAIALYRRAADQGHARAQFNLGRCYEKGRGVPQNWKKAVELYRQAAEQGDADAQYSIAWCYEKGKGVKQNRQQANEWYRKAAEQGNPRAQDKISPNRKGTTRSPKRTKQGELNRPLDVTETLQSVHIPHVTLEDVSIEDALELLRREAKQAGMWVNVICRDSYSIPHISYLNLTNVNGAQYLGYICSKTNCEYRIEGNIVIIHPQSQF